MSEADKIEEAFETVDAHLRFYCEDHGCDNSECADGQVPLAALQPPTQEG
jgi:hypothetical protein